MPFTICVLETFDNGEILHLETSLPSSSNIMNAYLQGFSVIATDKEIVQCVNVRIFIHYKSSTKLIYHGDPAV